MTIAVDNLKPRMAGVAWALLGCAVVGLALRRLSGGWLQLIPLPVALGWSTGIVLGCGLAWGLYRQPYFDIATGWRLPERLDFSWQRRSTWWLLWPEMVSLGLPAMALVTVLPPLAASSVGMICGALLLVIATVVLAPEAISQRQTPRQPTEAASASVAVTQCPTELATEPTESPSEQDFGPQSMPAEDEQQSMLRRREAHGEVVEGWLRIEFAEDQRELTCHIPFVPPLASIPDVELEDLEGCDWDVRLTACYPFGIRVAVRRRQSSPTVGQIGYCATASSTLRRAG